MLVLGAGFGLVVAPFGATVAIAVGVASALVLAGLLLASTPTVGMVGADFVAGRARIPLRLLGDPEELDAAACGTRAVPVSMPAPICACAVGWPAGSACR